MFAIDGIANMAKLYKKINISSNVLWVYDTPPSCDSKTTKSKMSSNITPFLEYNDKPILLHLDDVIKPSYFQLSSDVLLCHFCYNQY